MATKVKNVSLRTSPKTILGLKGALKGFTSVYSVKRGHSCFILTINMIKSNGLTAYETRWKKKIESQIVEFGECLLFQWQNPAKRQKLRPRFSKGLWLGRSTCSNEHILGTTVESIQLKALSVSGLTRSTTRIYSVHFSLRLGNQECLRVFVL